MERFGFGFPFRQRTSDNRNLVPFIPFGQHRLFLFLTKDTAPSGLSDDTALCNELFPTGLGFDGGHVLDTFLRESLQHTGDNHFIEDGFLFGEQERFHSGRQQCVVVGHLRVIHTPAGEFRICPATALHFGFSFNPFNRAGIPANTSSGIYLLPVLG